MDLFLKTHPYDLWTLCRRNQGLSWASELCSRRVGELRTQAQISYLMHQFVLPKNDTEKTSSVHIFKIKFSNSKISVFLSQIFLSLSLKGLVLFPFLIPGSQNLLPLSYTVMSLVY